MSLSPSLSSLSQVSTTFTETTMASSSYCTRWLAIAYFTMAAILALFAISMTIRSDPDAETPQSSKPISHVLSLSASRTLRTSGFTIMATLLQISPELFLSSPNSTIFAIQDSQDSQISNASLPPHLLRNLLRYHTSPVRVSIEDLMEKPQGTCLPTLYLKKSVSITKIDRKERTVQINHVRVSHPNLFLEGPVSIHGVLGPFAALDPTDDVIQAPVCDSNSTMVSDFGGLKKHNVEWSRIIRTLSSNGFVSFAIGLHSVLDGILEDERGASSATIFVPPRLELEAYHPLPLLEKIVRFHILPQRLTHSELSSLPARTLLRTMVHGQPLEVTGVMSFMPGLVINGVRIVAPDIYSSKNFIVHGISRAFEESDLPSAQ